MSSLLRNKQCTAVTSMVERGVSMCRFLQCFVREEDLEILSRCAGGQDTGQLLRAGASPFPADNFCQNREPKSSCAGNIHQL